MYALLLAAAITSCSCAKVILRTPAALACDDGGGVQIINGNSCAVVLEFDGTQDARVERRGDGLHVVEWTKWPFGRHWKWIEVPLFAWTIDRTTTAVPKRSVLLPKPAANAVEIRKMLARYRAWLRKPADQRDDAEEFVGRLFAAAVSGNREARHLLLTMHHDAHLDGGSGEVCDAAVAELELLR